jgi:hypothetical protein
MAAGMMMSSMGEHPPPPPSAASLGQQNNPDVVESEPEIYAEMMKQQLKRKNGTWMTTANMDGKVVHAQGFPKGWTVSVGLRHKTGQLFYEYKQWKRFVVTPCSFSYYYTTATSYTLFLS